MNGLGWLIAAFVVGYGVGAFTIGPLKSFVTRKIGG